MYGMTPVEGKASEQASEREAVQRKEPYGSSRQVRDGSRNTHKHTSACDSGLDERVKLLISSDG